MSKASEEKNNNAEGWRQIAFSEIEVGERIGGGGVGVIYSGWFNNENVALKTLFDTRVSEELKQEYMDELLIMSRVRHSNIVKFIGACMTPPNLFFVMELCECSLFDCLHHQRQQFPPKEIVRMAIDVGSAMEYLHCQRPAIIHRDLKSHNVLKAYDGSLKICDFGLVKVRSTTAGTPAYMAPELLEGLHFSKSVDVYAFGILLWEMCTQSIPFYMVDLADIRRRVIAGDRPRLPSIGISTAYNNLIEQCWSQRSEERGNFTAVVDKLIEIHSGMPDTRYAENMVSGDILDSFLK